MRKHEMKEGIEVTDADGKVVGTSQVAAKHVSKTWSMNVVVVEAGGECIHNKVAGRQQ